MIYRAETGGRALIAQIRAELPITPLPPEATFLRWLSSLEALLWGEVVREKKTAPLTVAGGRCSLSSLPVGTGEGDVLAADLTAVYRNGEELRRASFEDLLLFAPESPLWTKSGAKEIAVGGVEDGAVLDCVYLVRPAVRTGAEEEDAPVALPEEFIELAASKLRGEACRLAGEDALCAKWFSDYNAKLESFAAWCDRRRGGQA